MQAYELTVDKFLDHAAKWAGGREVVTATADGGRTRTDYATLRERSNRLSGALQALGLRPGDRVGTLAWNTQHHLEAYYALMGVGLVCHTLNPRLTAAQLAVMVGEAHDRVLAVSDALLPLLRELLPLCPDVEHVILMDAAANADAAGDGVPPADLPTPTRTHEALLRSLGHTVAWGRFDEETPAGLCYTSGTTGRPKGVLYTHRSNYLHTLRALQADAMALSRADSVLVAVPMFHANGWGLPFAAPAVGAKLVLPGRHLDGASLYALMREEEVTLAVGVQTVWLGLLDHMDAVEGELPALRRVLIGGSRCPDALLARMEARLGVHVQTSWGMTELSPTGTVEPPGAPLPGERASGLPAVGLDLKLTDAAGVDLPQQRGVLGHLKVKGASVIDRYFGAEESALDADGWFDTGDLAVIDAQGCITIGGRSKDLIKSGGEWINPAEIEEIVGRIPAVGQVAVIGRADARWGERPVLVVEPRRGDVVDAETLLAALRGKVATWWIPDQVVAVAHMPLAATGKIDKVRLRADYNSGALAA